MVPAFVNEFTGSQLLIGGLAALRVLMITLPQVWAASVLEARPRMKPLLVWSSFGGRLPIFFLALAVWLWGPSQIWLVIGVLALSVAAFFTSEGLNSVSWPALVGKVVPEHFRGRFFGIGQFLSAVGSAGAGYVVNLILDYQGWARSTRWAMLFLGAFLGLMASVGSMFFIREKPAPPNADKPDVRRSLGKMWAFLREDRWLRRMIVVQLIMYTASAPFTFFVVRARQILPNADALIGTFVILQSVGSAASALVSGILIDRVGSWVAIRGAAMMEVLALGAVTVGGLLPTPLPFYAVAFLLVGYVNGTLWWSFSTYLLDIASEARRPLYLAASGILISVTVLNPVIVGALFGAVRPELLFAGAGALAIAGLALAWTLRQGIAARESGAT